MESSWIALGWLACCCCWLVAGQPEPLRTEKPNRIILDNGATALISSLEEYLASSSEAPQPAETRSGGPVEREQEAQESPGRRKSAQLSQSSATEGAERPEGTRERLAAANQTTSKPIPQHWQVKSLLNVTHDYPLAYSQIICGYIWPLMAHITLFTNLMIVFVLTQRDMRTPTNVVLTAIAIADIIPIVVPVPWFVYLFAMGNEKQVLYPPIVCYFYQHSTRSISEIFYFLSTWLNVLLAVQDYLTASWPQLAKKYCQIKVVVVEIVSLTLLAFLLNLPQALKLVFKPVKFYYNGQLTWGCRALQAKWFKDLVGEYVALYDDIFTAVIVIFVDGGPALALITLTALLIRQLQRQRIQGHLLMEQARTASKRRRVRHRQLEYEASARVMIFVLLAFLAVKIPFATTYTLMIVQSRFEIHFVDNLVDFQRAITLIDLVFVLSYPINFTIFCCCSKKFRHKCAQLISERLSRCKLMEHRDSIASIDGSSADGDTLAGSLHRKFTLEEANHHTHHSQQMEQPRRPSSVETTSNSRRPQQLDNGLRRLIEDGNLCLECVWHYEQIKRGQRRASSDSTPSWPASLPPPLAPSHLPSIITTRCESIREQPSPSWPREQQSGSPLDRSGAAAQDDQASTKTVARAPLEHQLHRWADFAHLNGATESKANGQQAAFERLGRLQQRSVSGSSIRVSSDPGNIFLGARQLDSLQRRQSSSQTDQRQPEAQSRPINRLGVLGNRRSLSLSDSKLSTLPNATGLLADILMTSLLGPGIDRQLDARDLKNR